MKNNLAGIRIPACILMLTLLLTACSAPPSRGQTEPVENLESISDTANETPEPTVLDDPDEEVIVRMDLSNVGYPSMYSVSSKGQGYVMLQMIFDTLMWKDENGVIPYLAEDYDISDDNKVFTFYLRDNITFTDGVKLTANDVKFTFDYTKEHPYNYAATTMVKEVNVIDERTVEIVLEDVYVAFLSDVAGSLPILPAHIWQDITEPETFTEPEAVIATGPFLLESYEPDTGVYILNKNPDYFYGEVAIDKLIVSSYDDALEAFTSGELDVSATMGYNKAMTLRDNDDYKVLEGPGLWVSRLYLNFDEPALNVKEIRQAMYYAIDREAIVEKAFRGAGTPGSPGHIQPGSLWYTPDIVQYDYDIEKAQALMAEAGAADTDGDGIVEFDGSPLAFEALFSESDVQLAEMIVSNLSDIGISLTVKTADDQTVKTLIGEGNFTIAGNGNGSFGGDPVLLARFASDPSGTPQVTAQGGKNWYNETYNTIYEASTKELDQDARYELVCKLQEIIAEELPTLTLYYSKNACAYNPAVYDGYYYTPDGIGIAIPFPYNKLCFVND